MALDDHRGGILSPPAPWSTDDQIANIILHIYVRSVGGFKDI